MLVLMRELNSTTCLIPRPFACHLGMELIVSNVFHLKHTILFFTSCSIAIIEGIVHKLSILFCSFGE